MVPQIKTIQHKGYSVKSRRLKVMSENIKISVENYGPIAKAESIELRPLTVFVGPSNTGKSYLAVLIYALLRSIIPHQATILSNRRSEMKRGMDVDLYNKKPVDQLAAFLENVSERDREKIKILDLPDDLKQWVEDEIFQQFTQSFKEELSRCFSMSTEKNSLINDNFILSYQDSKKKFRLGAPNNESSLKIVSSVCQEEIFKENFRFADLIGNGISKRGMGRSKKIIADEFISCIKGIINDTTEIEPCYLPAARASIMQTYQAIVEGLVRNATLAGLEEVSVPALSGIASDFLQQIISMNTDAERDEPAPDVAKVADKMENTILHGSIKVEKSGANQYPQFSYNPKEGAVPLLHSSSMVSELAPIVLSIRQQIEKGDLLIIEEPEAHLHPAAQRQVAEAVVELIEAGVRVLVITHGEYFLEQLSNHVRLAEIDEAKREGKTALSEQDIAAYAFIEKQRGTVVERLDFDKENGLSPEDHDAVSSDLYNETVGILEKMDIS